MAKHFFLFLFFIMFTFNLMLSGLLLVLHHRTQNKSYRKLAWCFGSIGLVMLFWYVSSYMVLNIIHRDTLLYTTVEALGVLFVGMAAFHFYDAIASLITGTSQRPKLLPILVIIVTSILIFTKFTQYIFVTPWEVFFRLKQLAVFSLIFGAIILSAILLFQKKDTLSFPTSLRTALGIAGIILPIFGAVDFLVIRHKFYEGPVRLSMNYPLFISGSFILYTGLAILLFRQIGLVQKTRLTGPPQSLKFIRQIYQITPREMEIVQLIVQGKSNPEIAAQLFISIATVKNHVHHIFEKMNVNSRMELVSRVLSENKPENES